MLSWEHGEGSCWADLCSDILKSLTDPTKWRLTSPDPDLHRSSRSKVHPTQQPVCSSDQQTMPAGRCPMEKGQGMALPSDAPPAFSFFGWWTSWARITEAMALSGVLLGNLFIFPLDPCKHPQYPTVSLSSGCPPYMGIRPSCTTLKDSEGPKVCIKWSSK